MKSLVASMLAAAALVAVAPSARADKCDENSQANQQKKAGKNFHIEYRNGQKVTVLDDIITVCGKVPRPAVAYVLQAKNIDYEWENLKQDFLPLILDSVKKAPF
jgi:orotate phosphoribosyltransferase